MLGTAGPSGSVAWCQARRGQGHRPANATRGLRAAAGGSGRTRGSGRTLTTEERHHVKMMWRSMQLRTDKSSDQATKGAWWMPWRQEPMKDVVRLR